MAPLITFSPALSAAQFEEQLSAANFTDRTVMNFSIRNQTCPNTACTFFEQPLAGNVNVHSRRYQRFICKGCNKTWVAHRNDLTYRLHADPEKLNKTILLVSMGRSVRAIARLLNISPSTVQRWKSKQFLPMVAAATF